MWENKCVGGRLKKIRIYNDLFGGSYKVYLNKPIESIVKIQKEGNFLFEEYEKEKRSFKEVLAEEIKNTKLR